MKRLIVMSVLLAVSVVVAAGPALASQCPKLIGEIAKETSNRLDAAAYDAKMKAAEAEKLHKAGKHADSVKAAQEGLAKIGKKM